MSFAVKSKMSQVVCNIRKVRHYRNYSQDYVALKVGISQHGYSKIENGLSSISVARLYQIANALDVSIKDLLELEISNLKPLTLSKMTLVSA